MGTELLVPPNKEDAFCLREFFIASVKYKFSDVIWNNLVAMLLTKSGMEYVSSTENFEICAGVQPHIINQYLLY